MCQPPPGATWAVQHDVCSSERALSMRFSHGARVADAVSECVFRTPHPACIIARLLLRVLWKTLTLWRHISISVLS